MVFHKRLTVAGILLVSAVLLYGAARHYSPSLVEFVVKQSIIQKAPDGTDPVYIKSRLHDLLGRIQDPEARLQRLLQISAYLEKTQSLTREQLEKLLTP